MVKLESKGLAFVGFLIAIGVTLALTGCIQKEPTGEAIKIGIWGKCKGVAYFRFTDGVHHGYEGRQDTFVFKLTEAGKIQKAREILSGKETKAISVGGIIVKEPARYNSPWSYHLEPSSIYFFEVAMEVCDASIQAIEQDLNEVCGAFLPECRWCPWSSILIEEIPDPGCKEPTNKNPIRPMQLFP